MVPTELADELSKQLNDGTTTAVTFEALADELGVKEYQVRQDLYPARKRLEENHTPTMLVTQFYFDLKDEPKNRDEAWKCCALHGRPAVGVRLLFPSNNDLLGIVWLQLNQTSASGIQSANLNRITVGYTTKKLSLGTAKSLVDKMGELKMPFHEQDFAKLMQKTKK
jgi:hypothetical protein